MDAERAHRLAHAMLAWPLPWRRIGRTVQDPSLETDLAGIPLRNPIGLAAGFDKACDRLDALGSLGFGYVVGGTVTRGPRGGNPAPRLVRERGRGALINAMGLPNPGAAAAARNLERSRRTCPRLVSLADEVVEDAVSALAFVEPHADGLEINASCPNVGWGRDRDNEAHLRALVSAVRARTEKPVFVKLPPFADATERDVVLALAGVAAEAGANGFTCGNTRPIEDPRLSVERGGLSGRPLFDDAVRSVGEIREATGLVVNACGGIATAEDVAACLAAGARTVQVYTALVYEGPGLVGALTRGLRDRVSVPD